MFKSHKKAILSVIMAALISCTALTAFADETDSAEEDYSENISSVTVYSSEPVSEDSKIASSDVNSDLQNDIDTFVSEIIDNSSHVSKSDTDTVKDSSSKPDTDTDTDTATSNAIPDYYGDDKYDTSGNLSLVREQKIIYDSAEMQFIAVTTKDGHIFYILIDYTAIEAAEDGEDGANARETVYFLNKVDDYDLFTLLYSDSDSDIGMRDYFIAGMDNTGGTDTASENDTDTDKESDKKSNSPMVGFYIVLAVAIVIFAFAYYFLKIKPKKKEAIEDDDFDFDYEDEEEISEDTEIDDDSENADTKPEE